MQTTLVASPRSQTKIPPRQCALAGFFMRKIARLRAEVAGARNIMKINDFSSRATPCWRASMSRGWHMKRGPLFAMRSDAGW
jgi:hypothetical protein